MNIRLTTTRLILYTAIFWVLLANNTFFQHVTEVFPLSLKNSGFLISVAVVLTASIVLLLTLTCWKQTTKPILITLLLVSAFTAYFMDHYNVVIDHTMIQNTLETNTSEALDLLSIQLLGYLLVLGIIPASIVYKTDIISESWKKFILVKIRDIVITVIVTLSLIVLFSDFYTSFFREYKPLRFYTNPTYYLYSAAKYIHLNFSKHNAKLEPIGTDATVIETDDDKIDADQQKNSDLKELIILVVGEAARADHFSLNGYTRETNPLLKQEAVINFSNLYSCGTSTAVAVPCMFSIFGKADYTDKHAKTTENVLDVLNHTGKIAILWRDNNSDSKGVALRVAYEDFRQPEKNLICTDGECRDEGMLLELDTYIQQHQGQDILIILHQMGNHGPAYYKRYPKTFEQFKPVCQTNQLESCQHSEIVNAYDNAILYTDYFLAKAINFLKQYNHSHEAALIYLSDHGESLGENSIYLHGMPYIIAPDAQKHVAALMWFNDKIKRDIDFEYVKKNADQRYTQDHLFHTLIGLFEVQTSVYNPAMDILHEHH